MKDRILGDIIIKKIMLNKVEIVIDKWFLGNRAGKAEDYVWCKKGILSYSRIKELKKKIKELDYESEDKK